MINLTYKVHLVVVFSYLFLISVDYPCAAMLLNLNLNL